MHHHKSSKAETLGGGSGYICTSTNIFINISDKSAVSELRIRVQRLAPKGLSRPYP